MFPIVEFIIIIINIISFETIKVVPKSKILVEKKIIVEEQLKSTISLIKEKTSFHPNIGNVLR